MISCETGRRARSPQRDDSRRRRRHRRSRIFFGFVDHLLVSRECENGEKRSEETKEREERAEGSLEGDERGRRRGGGDQLIERCALKCRLLLQQRLTLVRNARSREERRGEEKRSRLFDLFTNPILRKSIVRVSYVFG